MLESQWSSIPSSVLSSHAQCQSAPDPVFEEDKSEKVDYSENVEDDVHVLCAAKWRPALCDGPLYIELNSIRGELNSSPAIALVKESFVRVGVEQVENSRSWIHVFIVLGLLLALCVGAPIAFLLAALAQNTALSETAIHMLVSYRDIFYE